MHTQAWGLLELQAGNMWAALALLERATRADARCAPVRHPKGLRCFDVVASTRRIQPAPQPWLGSCTMPKRTLSGPVWAVDTRPFLDVPVQFRHSSLLHCRCCGGSRCRQRAWRCPSAGSTSAAASWGPSCGQSPDAMRKLGQVWQTGGSISSVMLQLCSDTVDQECSMEH